MSIVVNVLRSDDLLNLQIEFVNLDVHTTSGATPKLKRAGNGPAFIVVRLPPQHIAEEALDEGVSRTPPYKAFMSGPSRLAFRLPDGDVDLQFDLPSVLKRLTELAPHVDGLPDDGAPATVVEFPDRLLIVPDPNLRMDHRFAPLDRPSTGVQWAELWHTRMIGQGSGANPLRFRAVHNPQDQLERDLDSTLKLQDRTNIVERSAAPDPHVVAAPWFMLSALGATAHLRSTWPDGGLETLSAWEHRSTLGRDAYVRILRQGFLFPFGHRASLTTITNRRLEFTSVGPAASLRRPSFLTPQETVKNYDDRRMPLRQVQIDALIGSPITGGPHTVTRAAISASDFKGNLIRCELDVVFVPLEDARKPQEVEAIWRNEYEGVRNSVRLNYQRLAIAEDRDEIGDTGLDAASITLGVDVLDPGQVSDPSQPLFRPFMQSVEASIPALERMQGAVGNGGMRSIRPRIKLRHSDQYKEDGFDGPNSVKQVFANFEDEAVDISLPARRAGGLAAPQFKAIDGLSRTLGPVSDVRRFVGELPPDPELSAEDIVGEASLFGSIFLKDLIEIPAGSATDEINFLASQPELLFTKIDDDTFVLTRPVMTTARVDGAATMETRFAWKPQLKIGDIGILRAPNSMRLAIWGSMRAGPAVGDSASLDVQGRLKNFSLSLGGLATISFNHVEFKSVAGGKMSVNTDISGLKFESKLEFAEKLREIIPIGALSGADVRLLPDGVLVSYTLALPAAGMGVLSFENIAVVSSISLPFVDGRPAAVRFSLSERSHPFMVSVAPFGGTGFFALEVRTNGTLMIEAAIEFGGIISINLLGIVRGGVYLLAGVYMALQTAADLSISAHLRIGGYVDVLGLVSVSIEFYLALTFDGTKLAGEAVLTIGVKVLFFNEQFSFRVHKEIAHMGGIPRMRFIKVMQVDQWTRYCKAFASS